MTTQSAAPFEPTPRDKKLLATSKGFAAVALMGTCLLFGLLVGAAKLWGPYAQVFADAGPLVVSRGGLMLIFAVMPLVVLLNLVRQCDSWVKWGLLQVVTILFWVVSIYGYGYYLHHIVQWQGVPESIEFVAGEVGFEAADKVPAHVKEAILLSDTLAREGAAPWKPGDWTAVTWPVIPNPTEANKK